MEKIVTILTTESARVWPVFIKVYFYAYQLITIIYRQ